MQITIKTSYWGLGFNVMGYLFLVCMYIWLIFAKGNSNITHLIIQILASIMIFVFVYAFITGILQLIKNKPALIISKDGITNNFAGFDSYHLHWNEIESFKLKTIWFRKYIGIKSTAGKEIIKNLPLRSRIKFYIDNWQHRTHFVLAMDDYDFNDIGKTKDFIALLNGYWEASKEPLDNTP